jgi:hypothetical protein
LLPEFFRTHDKVSKQRLRANDIKQENTANEKQLQDLEVTTKKQTEQIRKLSAIISDADEEIKLLQKQYAAVVDEVCLSICLFPSLFPSFPSPFSSFFSLFSSPSPLQQRVLNNQLVKRNEELAELYEKLKLQSSMLDKGRSYYGEKMNTLLQLQEKQRQLEKVGSVALLFSVVLCVLCLARSGFFLSDRFFLFCLVPSPSFPLSLSFSFFR